MVIKEAAAFRVTRNADLTVEEEEADDLLEAVEMELRRRRFNRAVRLEVADSMSDEMLELLGASRSASQRRVPTRGLIGLVFLWELHGLDRPDLKVGRGRRSCRGGSPSVSKRSVRSCR